MNDDALLDRYLLGRTSPEETDAIELRLLEDPAWFESAQAAEFELLERFARGELAPEDRLHLTTRLHTSPRLRESLAFANSLIDIATQTPAPRRAGWSAWFSGLWAPAARPAWVAAAVASIGTVWLGSQNVDLRRELAGVATIESRVSELETERQRTLEQLTAAQTEAQRASESEARVRAEYAQRQQATAERGGGGRRLVTMSLTGTTRSGGTEANLQLAADRTHVQMELDLPATDLAPPVRAIVKRKGVPVWSENNLRVERSALGVIGILEVPRQSLVAGRYEIEVRSATGSVATFPLTVIGD
jgi:outer membrane murein-binding lipoprotein Lpp